MAKLTILTNFGSYLVNFVKFASAFFHHFIDRLDKNFSYSLYISYSFLIHYRSYQPSTSVYHHAQKSGKPFSGLPLTFYYPEFGGIKLFFEFLQPFLQFLLQLFLVRQIERILCCVYVGIFRKRQLNQRVFFAFAE